MPLKGMVTGIGDPLAAIHGMPPWTPLLQSVGAAQSQITTARLEPPLSLAVPYSMTQTCPKRRGL